MSSSYDTMSLKYARRIKDGTISFDDVPERRKQNVRSLYLELYGEPIEDL